MPWVLILFAAAAFVGIASVLRWSAVACERRRAAWKSCADQRGHRWIDASGPWYHRKCAAVEGTREGIPFRLDTVVVRHGKSSKTYTRASAPLAREIRERVDVTRRSVFTPLAELLGIESVTTGDPRFDERFVARSRAKDVVRALLAERVRRSLEALGGRFRVRAEHDAVEVRWRGVETEAERIDDAIAAATGMAREAGRS